MKIRNLTKLLIILVPFIFASHHVFAADITIVCDESGDSSDCKITSESTILFNESNWAPGQTISKSVQVTNNDKNDDCSLKMSTNKEAISPAGFSHITFTAIKRDGQLLFGNVDVDGKATSIKDLQSVFDASNIDFGEVSKGGVAIYDWLVTFDKDAGNEYQGANVSFDFGINFECDHNSSSSNSSDGGTTSSVAGAVTSAFSFFGRGATSEPAGGEIAGVSTEKSKAGVQEGEVAGIQTCRDTWVLWLLFALQLLVLFVVSRKAFKAKGRLLYIVSCMLILPLIYYPFLCDKRYTLVSFAISLFWYIFRKRPSVLSHQ